MKLSASCRPNGVACELLGCQMNLSTHGVLLAAPVSRSMLWYRIVLVHVNPYPHVMYGSHSLHAVAFSSKNLGTCACACFHGIAGWYVRIRYGTVLIFLSTCVSGAFIVTLFLAKLSRCLSKRQVV